MTDEQPHTCSECGAYKGHRPIVEYQRNPRIAGGAWEIFIYDPHTMRFVVIGARDNGDWNVSPPLSYTEGSRIDPWTSYDADGLKAMIQHREQRIAELEQQLAALKAIA